MTLNLVTECEVPFSFDIQEVADQVLEAVMDYTECPYEVTVDLTLTDDKEIHAINKEQRNVDRATDVLSFPMTQFPVPGDYGFLEEEDDSFDPDSGELMLGDIVISVEHVVSQAKEFGHSERREYAFLIAHSLFHLIGYDHMTEEEAAVMEEKQKTVLDLIGITRDMKE